MKKQLLFLLTLLTIVVSSNSYAQANKLSEQVKGDFNMKATKKALDGFYYAAISDKKGRIKDKSKNLKAQAELVKQQSGLAYNRTKQLIQWLKDDNLFLYVKSLEKLKSDFYSLNYAAKAMIDVCNWTIRSPKNARRNYKSVEKAFNKMADKFNSIQKNKHNINNANLSLRYAKN
uniref:hypothetical protein n=1 Tax=uncultured Polaribacter sp. TaxID=174711 RepID=UPI0026285BE8|nr:hypothetical protein [uncultured Polaribacter sp.]